MTAALREDDPVLDISVLAVPRTLDDETIFERVLLVAARRHLAVHHVTIQHVGNVTSISFDLEVDGAMTHGAAHEIATALEGAVREEIGPQVEVESHIEPLTPELRGHDESADRVATIAQRLSDAATRGGVIYDVHKVRVRRAPEGLIVNYHCRIDPLQTVNAVHSAGYSADGTTGQDFFSGDANGNITAESIKVAVTDPAKVAFSSGNPVSADPTVAGTINNDVADKLSATGSSGTGPDQVYQQMVGQLGVSAQASSRRSDIQNSVRDQVDSERGAESGVNLDEEMTNLLTYQRGYEAASRVLTTIDSMLDQLINKTMV